MRTVLDEEPKLLPCHNSGLSSKKTKLNSLLEVLLKCFICFVSGFSAGYLCTS